MVAHDCAILIYAFFWLLQYCSSMVHRHTYTDHHIHKIMGKACYVCSVLPCLFRFLLCSSALLHHLPLPVCFLVQTGSLCSPVFFITFPSWCWDYRHEPPHTVFSSQPQYFQELICYIIGLTTIVIL